jgi:hypothetical protein
MPLTDTQIRNLKPREKTYKVSDGGRLQLHVTSQGSKLWRMAYNFDGKENTLSFGQYPAVTLAQARERRAEAKALLANGVDPSAQKKADKIERTAKTEDTFSNIAEELLAKLEKEGKAEGTMRQKRRFISLANVDLADRPITEITAAEILTALKRVEAKGNYETARRLRKPMKPGARVTVWRVEDINDLIENGVV